jgi:hypothetical protein
MSVPSFDQHFASLNQFVLELVAQYNAGKLNSWDDLEPRVNTFFTHARMEQMESILPHWQKMSSYLDGGTLVHVVCVFLGLYMLPEYHNLTPAQQNLMKWIVLFHDVEKEVEKGKRDPMHAFCSAATAARRLPSLGFETTAEYSPIVNTWSELTSCAETKSENTSEPIQDNRKLPEILRGIDSMFGKNTPAALITKTVLFHMSITVVKDWPQFAPLSEEEILRYIDKDLLPLLKVMTLADNEGWTMFYPDDRLLQRMETLATFEQIESNIF